jgi:ABC-type branched-subunit amino acid transport system substrate-binding protein
MSFMNGKKRVRAAAAGVTLLSLLAALGSTGIAGASSKYPPIPKGPITLGISTPLSGLEASYGLFTKIGINAALAAFDAEHPTGIDGHQVKVQILNDGSDVTQAVSAANQIVANKDTAVISVSYNPAAVPQQLAVFTKAKMPVIADLGGTQYVNTKQYPYLFSPGASIQEEATAVANWMKRKDFTKVAMLGDGVAADAQEQSSIIGDMKKGAPKAKLVATKSITPGAVDDSAAITALQASGAQLLVVNVGEAYGPIWQAIQAANWSPTILVSAGAWYSGFTAMGSLTAKAYAYYYNCASSAAETFTPIQTSLMAGFAKATGDVETNYLTFMSTDSVPFELLNYAVTKYHSVSPAAIQAALQGIHNKQFLGIDYNYSATNHYGLTGQYGAAVCQMGPPYAGGTAKVPVKS